MNKIKKFVEMKRYKPEGIEVLLGNAVFSCFAREYKILAEKNTIIQDAGPWAGLEVTIIDSDLKVYDMGWAELEVLLSKKYGELVTLPIQPIHIMEMINDKKGSIEVYQRIKKERDIKKKEEKESKEKENQKREREERMTKEKEERKEEAMRGILRDIADIKKHNFLAKQGAENYEKKHQLVESLMEWNYLLLQEEGVSMIEIVLIEARDSYYSLYEFNLIKDGETFGICHIPKEIADDWESAEWVGQIVTGRTISRDSYEEYRQEMKELSEKYEADNSYDGDEEENEETSYDKLKI